MDGLQWYTTDGFKKSHVGKKQLNISGHIFTPGPGNCIVQLLRTSLCREGTRQHGLLAQKDGKWMGAIVWEVD